MQRRECILTSLRGSLIPVQGEQTFLTISLSTRSAQQTDLFDTDACPVSVSHGHLCRSEPLKSRKGIVQGRLAVSWSVQMSCYCVTPTLPWSRLTIPPRPVAWKKPTKNCASASEVVSSTRCAVSLFLKMPLRGRHSPQMLCTLLSDPAERLSVGTNHQHHPTFMSLYLTADRSGNMAYHSQPSEHDRRLHTSSLFRLIDQTQQPLHLLSPCP